MVTHQLAKGGETEKKFRKYAQIGVWYYAIFDPQKAIQEDVLQIYQLSIGRYVSKPDPKTLFTDLGLGLALWDGEFEGMHAQWLRTDPYAVARTPRGTYLLWLNPKRPQSVFRPVEQVVSPTGENCI